MGSRSGLQPHLSVLFNPHLVNTIIAKLKLPGSLTPEDCFSQISAKTETVIAELSREDMMQVYLSNQLHTACIAEHIQKGVGGRRRRIFESKFLHSSEPLFSGFKVLSSHVVSFLHSDQSFISSPLLQSQT